MNTKIKIRNFPQALTEVLNAIDRVEDKLNQDSAYHKEIISIHEASAFLNLSVATIYGNARRRQIPVYRKGKKLLFSRKELSVWAEAGFKLSSRKPRKSISLREFKMK